MAILEELFVIYKADASQLKKTNQEVEKDNEKTAESFKQVDHASSKVGQSFLGLARNIAGLALGYASLSAVVGGLKESLSYAAEIDQASKSLNVNVETLDVWSNAVRKTGGTAASFQAALRGLSQHLNVTPKNALRLLPRLADSFQRMSQFRAMNFGKMLGLDEATILLLQKGRREVDSILQRQRELGVVTKNQAELSRALNYELGNTGHAFRSLFLALGETVIPKLIKFLELLQDIAIYFQSHTAFIEGALIAIGSAALYAAVAFGLLSSPILLVIAAIGLFALAYDDLKVFFEGGDSLIGRAAKRWPKALHAIKIAFDDLRKAWEWFTSVDPKDQQDMLANMQRMRDIDNGVTRGKSLIDVASKTDLNALSSGAILNNQSSNRSNVVKIDEINIITQATDAPGIGTALGSKIQEYFHANSQFDDGIYA